MLKLPVLDVDGEKLGVVNDFGIATGEVFPHVTSLAFRGPGKTPFMISWRKWVDRIDETGVHLKTSATEIRFSYLQPTELLLARDVLNKQIVDTQGMKVVRVNDIKFSMSGENQLRLLGAEVGARGLLRAISPALEHIVEGFMKHLGKPLSEDIIAWSYMDLLDRSTKNIQLSVSHKTLGELHPADIADIIEQLDPRLRAQVFAQLDTAQAAEAISEFDDDELMTEMLEGLSDTDASSMLAMMDPDDAADLIDELDYEKAEKLLRLMGVKEEKAIRNLLGYEDNTAGRIMTSEFVSLPATATVGDAIEAIRKLDEDFESVYYVYTEDPSGMLTGVLSLRTLIVADRDATLGQLAYRDLVYVSPDEDQEDVTDETRRTCRSQASARATARRTTRRTCSAGSCIVSTGSSCGALPRALWRRCWGRRWAPRIWWCSPCAPCRSCCWLPRAWCRSSRTTSSSTTVTTTSPSRTWDSSSRARAWA